MKFYLSILILSIITYVNTTEAILKAVIPTKVTKKSLATTDEISVKITNTGDEAAAAGTVTGLSLVASAVSKTVELTCDDTTEAIAITSGTATVTCKPKTAEDTEGTYVLTATDAKVGTVSLTVDTDNSQSVIISSTASSNSSSSSSSSSSSGDSDNANYQKISFILYAIALLF